MQGVEVFESVGAAAEELKPKDAIVREAASAAPHAEVPAACAEGPKPSRFQRHNLVKQSGVPGVKWNRTCFAWEVQSRSTIPKVREKARQIECFPSRSSWSMGALRQRLTRPLWRLPRPSVPSWCARAFVKEPKERDPNFTSDVPGVLWSKREQEVASGDFFEEKQSKGATEKDIMAAISPRRRRPRPRPCGSKSCTACNAR